MFPLFDTSPQAQAEERKAKEKQEYRCIGSMKKIRGLTLFECNLKTGEISKTEIKTEFNLIDGNVNKAQAKQGFLYTQALNFKNAQRKFQKQYNHLKHEQNKPLH